MSKQGLNSRGRPKKVLATLASVLAAAVLAARAEKNTCQFPLTEYQQDPVGFCRDILGMRCWSRQAEMIESVIRHMYTTVRSGRRTGKTIGMAALALWRFCCFRRGQVLITSTTRDQLENLWGEIRMLHAQSGLCVDCAENHPDVARPCPHSAIIPEPCGNTSRSGVKGRDPRFRRYILGKTARKVSAAQGFGGPECLILIDECSGIADELFAGYLGSLASGGAALCAGQPHYRRGYFYETFRSPRWHKLAISSKESPNYASGQMDWPGLATREWVDGEIAEHGEDSSHVAIHILGEFPSVEATQLFSDERIATVTARYAATAARGRLHVAIDPAGDGTEGRGDYTAISFRRGLKILQPPDTKGPLAALTFRGLDDESILNKLLALLPKVQLPGEVPVINVDSEGLIGKNLRVTLQAYQLKHPGCFEAWGQRGSDNAKRDPRNYDKHRDEMAANFDRWVKEGGTFPNDPQLIEEVQLLGWTTSEKTGKAKITPKDDFRRLLGRSPDRLDACILTCWQAPGTTFEQYVAPVEAVPIRQTPQEYADPRSIRSPSRSGGLDPFAGRR